MGMNLHVKQDAHTPSKFSPSPFVIADIFDIMTVLLMSTNYNTPEMFGPGNPHPLRCQNTANPELSMTSLRMIAA